MFFRFDDAKKPQPILAKVNKLDEARIDALVKLARAVDNKKNKDDRTFEILERDPDVSQLLVDAKTKSIQLVVMVPETKN